MATTINSAVVISPSIGGAAVQSSAITGRVAVFPSAPAVIHSLAVTSGVTISLDHQWEMHNEQFVYAPGISTSLPSLTFQGTGQSDILGVLTLPIPTLNISWAGSDNPVGTINLTLPRLSLGFSASVNEIGTLTLSIPALKFAATESTGSTGVLSISIPPLRLSTIANLSAEGTLAISIPMLQGMFISAPTTYLSMVLNIRNNALTEYANYNFNSMCRFNGKNLGATSAGIFDLDTGETDHGTLIDWNFRSAYIDLERNIKKKITQAWFSCKTDGEIIVSIVQPNGNEYEYPLSAVDITEDGIRAIFGKGIKGRYVAIDTKNVDGSTITLDTMRLNFMKTSKER